MLAKCEKWSTFSSKYFGGNHVTLKPLFCIHGECGGTPILEATVYRRTVISPEEPPVARYNATNIMRVFTLTKTGDNCL